MLMVAGVTMVSYVIKEAMWLLYSGWGKEIYGDGSLLYSYLRICPVFKSELSATPLLQNWHSLSWLLRWCYSFWHLSFSEHSDITPLLDVQLGFWEGFVWDSIWLMGAAGFLFVIWECLEHVTEHECALVGCTCVMKERSACDFCLNSP